MIFYWSIQAKDVILHIDFHLLVLDEALLVAVEHFYEHVSVSQYRGRALEPPDDLSIATRILGLAAVILIFIELKRAASL